MQKKKFVSPLVLSSVEVQMESPLLSQSVIISATMGTMGHDVDPHGDYDFSENPFTATQWE